MTYAWAIEWHDSNASIRCGTLRHFIGSPDAASGTMLFKTRAEARAYIAERWGYIKRRPDLRAKPFEWRMPRAVRVIVTVEKERAT